MIPRVPVMPLHFQSNFSSFAPRSETRTLYFTRYWRTFKISQLERERRHRAFRCSPRENNSVTYLELETGTFYEKFRRGMAKYLRTSKYLQSISWPKDFFSNDRENPQNEEMLCCFMSALRESTSLKELDINFPRGGGPSNLTLENMLIHTQSLGSLSLVARGVRQEDRAVAAARS
jgi:hypothetical protein